MLISLGQEPTTEELENMMGKMASPLTFSAYLTGMSHNLSQLSSKKELLAAFEAFQDEEAAENNSGVIGLDELRDSLAEYGMDHQDIEQSLAAFTRSSGFSGEHFMYRDFVNLLRGEDN
ncbi:myosin II regulatory light chain Rlc1 [Sugiyamaella lignohabitans]|uniref:Myosin II regulatory light chain Rlc1 n=1 Tax=Sugiyamaella lignohabitans TaxID=796027 RepID=A0A167E1X9_9ASCO|nr:myosin II regulatory light chain Rlc1 [Sugiyamaella lignohabitans]ANB13549.1 myosin II regulatory light chain Rlc1 [Sugiyamaella lignohabitans]